MAHEDVFRAPSGYWWAVHPVRRDRVFSLREKDEIKARVKYAEMIDRYVEAYKDEAAEKARTRAVKK